MNEGGDIRAFDVQQGHLCKPSLPRPSTLVPRVSETCHAGSWPDDGRFKSRNAATDLAAPEVARDQLSKGKFAVR